MKKIVLSALVFFCAIANAQNVHVQSQQIGTGEPAPRVTVGEHLAYHVADGYYHVPQHLAMYPTAGVIWTRVVQVECDKVGSDLKCDGYNWEPVKGRAEYLMVLPVLRKATEPVKCCEAQPPAPIIILKEVPAKKQGG